MDRRERDHWTVILVLLALYLCVCWYYHAMGCAGR